MKQLLSVIAVVVLCSAPTCADVDMPSLKTLPAAASEDAASPKRLSSDEKPSPAAPTSGPSKERLEQVYDRAIGLCILGGSEDLKCPERVLACYQESDQSLNGKLSVLRECAQKETVQP